MTDAMQNSLISSSSAVPASVRHTQTFILPIYANYRLIFVQAINPYPRVATDLVYCRTSELPCTVDV
jgi:hypothetical protein